ncbi:conserved hypothetical protein [Burkholderia sp. 8Y]|uniref:hypothetical protein n=1 Tax=Burkholderia sp. 8Y TaxID=2653133 RepID=UPI0012F1431C|nr:hypothetical protein [Burkholderia sp. 8Y]VXB20910.1 conserved hypothetical protein [Burkholderia sp. 8Y]
MPALRPALKKWLALRKHRMQRCIVGRIPMASVEKVAHVLWIVRSAFDANARANGEIRAEIGRDVLHLPKGRAGRACSGAQVEKLIDQRIYFGRDIRKTEAWADLDEIAKILVAVVKKLKQEAPARPVFISPFHFVSQYANIYIVERMAALLGLQSMSVVSGVPRNQYGDDHALIPGIKVLYTYGDANRNGLGVRVARSLKRDGVAVLFSDVPPFTMHRYPMETVEVTMFGKSARLHNGVFRMGESFGAVLLPFYLRFSRGRFEARLFDALPLNEPESPQRLAAYIETALNDNYEQWLPAGHPAMYAFAPSR